MYGKQQEERERAISAKQQKIIEVLPALAG
jgi:hypothetical protein